VTPSGGPLHPAASIGFQRAAEAYRRGRPDYPAEAVGFLAEVLDLSPGRVMLDLGAGTGKLTRLLVPFGAEVVAVEPVDAMREALAASLPEARVAAGRAEAIPLADATVDAAVAAQAFHWFDGPAALRELRRVLRPEGRLALVWNVRDEEGSEFWAGVSDLLAPYRGETPSHRTMAWLRPFDDTDLFTELRTRTFAYEHPTTRDGAVDRVLSTSFVAALPEQDQAVVRERVLHLLDTDPEIGSDADEFVLPYRTDVQWCVRL